MISQNLKKKSILLPVLTNLENAERVANSVDPDQMLHSAVCSGLSFPIFRAKYVVLHFPDLI